jgi:hypothetical protein
MASSTPTSVRSEDDDTVLFSADKDVFDRTDDYGDAGRA